jgi:hypothetical protein
MPLTHLTALKGAHAYLTEAENISLAAVEDDQTEEMECMENSYGLDLALAPPEGSDPAGASSSSPVVKHVRFSDGPASNTLSENLKKASSGVILDTTLSNYNRYIFVAYGLKLML